MQIEPDYEYVEENVMIIEEILRQRLEGTKNEQGVYVTPAFPKLISVSYTHLDVYKRQGYLPCAGYSPGQGICG